MEWDSKQKAEELWEIIKGPIKSSDPEFEVLWRLQRIEIALLKAYVAGQNNPFTKG